MMDLDAHVTQDARRQAVANALAWAPGLVRYAARYTHSIEDAEDAYQCAMELALRKAPSVERRDFINWLHTVVRREALRIRDGRIRECPTDDCNLDVHLERDVDAVAGPHSVAEWRERYRAIQDGLYGLGERKRVCLMMRSAGIPNQEIADALGLTLRTVAREVAEARAELRAFEVRLATGQECERMAALIDLVLDGDAQPTQLRKLECHSKHCPSCRETFRSAQDQGQLVASLVPLGLVASTDLMHSRPPDPAAVIGWWDRMSGAASVKVGNAMQLWLDLPQLVSSKAGAGALAAAAVSVVGAPLVVQSMRTESIPASPVQIAVRSPAVGTTHRAPPTIPKDPVAEVASPTSTRAVQRTRTPATTTWKPKAAPTRTIAQPVRTSTTVRRTAAPAASLVGSAGSEFAP